MRLRPVLVQLQLALQLGTSSSKPTMPASILCANSSPRPRHCSAYAGSWSPISFFSSASLASRVLDQPRPHRAMHRQVVPAGHALQVRIDLGRQVGVRPQEGHQRLAAAPAGSASADWAWRSGPSSTKRRLALLQVQRQVGDEGQAVVVGGDQAGEGMRAHQFRGDGAGPSDLKCGGWYMRAFSSRYCSRARPACRRASLRCAGLTPTRSSPAACCSRRRSRG